MTNYEFRKAGAVLTEQDFGRVVAGANGGPVTVQLVNTSAFNWLDLRLSLIQGDSDGGYGTASVGGFVLTNAPHSAGPLPTGGSLDLVLGWTTPAGVTGRTADLAALNFEADY